MLDRHRRFGSRAVVAAAAVTLVAAGVSASAPLATVGGSLPLQGDEFAAGDGTAPDGFAAGTASHWNVFNWAPGVPAAIATSFSMNQVDDSGRTVKRVFVSSTSNADVGSAASITNLSTSEDSGKSFLTTQPDVGASALNMTRLRDGSLLTVDFIPAWTDESHTAITLTVRTSRDGGKSWRQQQAPVSMPAEHQLGPMSNGMRIHRRPLVLTDGTLILPAYTVFKGTSKQRSIVLQSTDDGASWSLRSVIPATDQPGTNEVGWSYTADGRLTAVMRTVHSPEAHLVQSFSDDDGRTWSEATDLIGPDGTTVHGIFPDLVLQPNGTLLLTTGRPDVRVYVNYDGTGTQWDKAITAFANYPSTGNNGRYDGSSGNNSMENVGANTSVLFYDQCHVWGCGAYDQQFGVSAEYVSAVGPGVGKIDVASKLIDGTATLSGDFRRRNPRFPEQRAEGAFDGSSARGAEAVLSGRRGIAPTMQLELDREYTIDRVGLMLGHGEAQSATVEVSADGTDWTTVQTAEARRDRAMRYTDVDPVAAKFVRVTGLADATTTVSELELYAAGLDTFENEIPFSVPRGWSQATHAWMTNVPANAAYSDIGGDHSASALRLWDKWTDDNARISKVTDPVDHQAATMRWATADMRARFTFGALGVGTDGNPVKAWDFRLTPGTPASVPPTIEAFDGTTWTAIGQLSKVVANKTYLPLTIDTTATEATVTLGEDSFTTTVRVAEAGQQTGLHFSTSDPSEYGGIYYLDDVQVAAAG